MPVQSSYGASGEPNSMPRSVWSEWSTIQAPTSNLAVNCTFTASNPWASILDAIKLVIIPPTAPVSLSPTSGPAGQNVTVSGQGFSPNSYLIATFGGAQIPFSYTTDSSGNIPAGATLTVPISASAGTQTVTIIDSKFNYASANFNVTTSNVTINPTTGPIGTSVTVTGSNFIYNSTITINFDGNPMNTNPVTISAGPTGNFSATFNTPLDSAGIKQVSVTDGVNSPYANFTVTPSISLNPLTGPSGSTVNLVGSGFAASQPVAFTFAGSTLTTIPASVTANNTGSLNVSFIVPSGQTVGGKAVTATDALSNAATATFTITSSISLSPTIGNVGSTVTVSGSGFAANSAITAKFAGTTVTLSGTTGTSPSGSFTGANFTVPNWASNWVTGNVQAVSITDAVSNSASATYMLNTVSQSVTVAMSNSAPSATVTVNGGNPSPNTFAADGNSHYITIFAGSSFNLSLSNPVNARDGFIVSSAFSANSISYTASVTPITVTGIEQVQNTFSASFIGGSTSGDSLVLKGTYLGAGSYNIATLTYNTWSASAWTDYNTAVTFPASTTLSGSTTRWAIVSAYSTAPLTAGGASYPQVYYNQYLQTLSYAVIGGGSPSAPTATGTQFGSVYVPSLTTAATGYWFDASGSITISTPTGTNEQWAPNPASIAATSSHTQVVSMYNQYKLTVTASPSGAVGGTFQITYTQLGATYTNQPQTTTWMPWVDANTTATVSNSQNPVNSYAFSSYTNNGVTMNSAQTITLVYVAGITLSPTTGNVGSTVTVTAAGMLGSHSVTATFGGVAVTLSASTTTSAGGLSATFTVPASTSGAQVGCFD
jgi:hypothetical protein